MEKATSKIKTNGEIGDEKKCCGGERMNQKKGFTMMELLAVVTIGLVLMAMTIGTAMGMKNFYSRRETIKELKDLGCALLRYQMDMDEFPSGNDREGLIRLWTPQGTSEWTGPYNSPDIENALRDGWRNGYIYRRGRNANGTEIALILSPGKNGIVDSNLTNWTSDSWRESGDDIAWKVSESWNVKDKEGLTQVNLRSEAGTLVAANPQAAPATYTPSLPDAFEQPLYYVRCNENAAFLYSLGANGRNDSNLCVNGSPGGDDIAVSVEWSPNAAPQVLTPPPPPPPPPPRGSWRDQLPGRDPPPPRDPCP
jgi:prepilin-type N-terminal cleavage/methylation domain-containing protein